MNDSRLQYKVGFFVVVSLILIALLILNFSKGVTFGHSTYSLRIVLPNAAGLKATADVMMAGVSIGKVTTEELAPDGRSVNIKVTILSRYKIPHKALFHIDSLGFLGDQYVEVSAPAGTDPAQGYLKDGDIVMGTASFNLIEAAQSISGLIDQAKKTIKDLDQSITNVNASALSTNTLSHFVVAVSNLQVVSDRAVVAAGRAERLLSDNEEAFHSAIGNFLSLSARLTNTAGQLDQIVLTNKDDIRKIVSNLNVASGQLKQMAADLEAGKGPMGSLLKDEQLKTQIASVVSNTDVMTSEFGMFGHNLNQHGIWATLWKPKHVETNQPPDHPVKNQGH
jgi:phospholipid/cholesterol/gamma-HCH transport system substrate-binding protein